MDLPLFLGVIRGEQLSATVTENAPRTWAALALYLLAGVGALIVLLRPSIISGRSQTIAQLFWGISAIVLLTLPLIRQFDLDLRFLAYLKGLAKSQGWYDHRRVLAVVTLGSGFLAAIVMLIRWRTYVGEFLLRQWMALVGLAALGFVYLLRMTSTHLVEPLFALHFGCPTTDAYYEAIGCTAVLANLWRLLRKRVTMPELDTRLQRTVTSVPTTDPGVVVTSNRKPLESP